MSSAAVVIAPENSPALAVSIDRARTYAANAKATATRRGYSSDWRRFEAWCSTAGLCPLPADPETVAVYIAGLAEGHKPATIARHMAAVASRHRACGFDSPATMKHGAVASVWAGIRRTHGTAQAAKAPVLVPDLRTMVQAMPDTLLGVRDRALLLVGFAGAFRRSELVGLNCEDVEFTADGLVVTLRRSKTDQEGEGRKVGIPFGSNPETCPTRALRAWIGASGIEGGPLFRSVNRHGQMQPGRLSGFAVALIVKRRVGAVGLDASKFAGHSLRAGLATSAAIAGASERSIMNQTGHRSSTTLRRYIRDGSLFRDNAAARVGL